MERPLIEEATAVIEAFEGKRPAGWLGPWISESRVTPDLLAERGYAYLLDWCMDDQPVWLSTRNGGRILAVPYPQEVNDIPSIVARKDSAEQFADMIVDNFDEMLEQATRRAAGDGHRASSLSGRPAVPPPAPPARPPARRRSSRAHLHDDRRRDRLARNGSRPPRITAGAARADGADRHLFGHAGLAESLQEHVAVREIRQVPAQYAEPDRRAEPVARGDVFLRLLDQPKVPAAADERVVLADMFGSRNGGTKIGQRLLELTRGHQRQAVDRRVKSGKGVDRAHAQGPSAFHERLVQMTGAQQHPPEHDVAEREARVEGEGGLELAECPLMLARRAEAQPEDHPGPGVGRIVLQGILRMAGRLPERFLSVRQPIGVGRPVGRPAEERVGSGVGRLERDRPAEERLRRHVLLAVELVQHHDGARHEAPGVDAVRRLRGDPEALLDVEVRLDRRDDALGDLVLDGEEVAELAVVAVGPDVLAGLGVDELRRDPHAPASDSHAALEHVADAERLGDLAHIHGLPFVGEARVAGDDEQPAQARERGDEILGET